MSNEIKEISLRELLDTEFTINDKMEMVGTFTLARINMISDILTNLQEETERQSKAQVILDNQIAEMLKYKQRNEKAIEYCRLNKEFTPRLVDIENILTGDDNE